MSTTGDAPSATAPAVPAPIDAGAETTTDGSPRPTVPPSAPAPASAGAAEPSGEPSAEQGAGGRSPDGGRAGSSGVDPSATTPVPSTPVTDASLASNPDDDPAPEPEPSSDDDVSEPEPSSDDVEPEPSTPLDAGPPLAPSECVEHLEQGDPFITGLRYDVYFEAVVEVQSETEQLTAEVQATLDRLVELTNATDSTPTGIRTAFDERISEAMASDVRPGFTEPRCALVASELVEAMQRCDPNFVEGETPDCFGRCRISPGFPPSCTASSRLECEAVLGDEEPCLGTCRGQCVPGTGDPGLCFGACEGTCAGECWVLYDGTSECRGECLGSTAVDGGCSGGCVVSMTGVCNGVCVGACNATCSARLVTPGSCYGVCDGACEYAAASGCPAGSTISCVTAPTSGTPCPDECEGELTLGTDAVCVAAAQSLVHVNTRCREGFVQFEYESATDADANDIAEFDAFLTAFYDEVLELRLLVQRMQGVDRAEQVLISATSTVVAEMQNEIAITASDDLDTMTRLQCASEAMVVSVDLISDNATALAAARSTVASMLAEVGR